MAQNMDDEAVKRIFRTVEELRSGAIAQLPQAIEVVLEQAKTSGIPALIEAAQAAADTGVPALVKVYNDMLDSAQEYAEKAKDYLSRMGYSFD